MSGDTPGPNGHPPSFPPQWRSNGASLLRCMSHLADLVRCTWPGRRREVEHVSLAASDHTNTVLAFVEEDPQTGDALCRGSFERGFGFWILYGTDWG